MFFFHPKRNVFKKIWISIFFDLKREMLLKRLRFKMFFFYHKREIIFEKFRLQCFFLFYERQFSKNSNLKCRFDSKRETLRF